LTGVGASGGQTTNALGIHRTYERHLLATALRCGLALTTAQAVTEFSNFTSLTGSVVGGSLPEDKPLLFRASFWSATLTTILSPSANADGARDESYE
jgi:hypothetical protein